MYHYHLLEAQFHSCFSAPPCENFLFQFTQVHDANHKDLHNMVDVHLKIHFRSENAKSIRQHRKVTEGNFMAEAGGYIGMFMGFSLLQLPTFVATFAVKFSNLKRKK